MTALVIRSATRPPIGAFKGGLAAVPPAGHRGAGLPGRVAQGW